MGIVKDGVVIVGMAAIVGILWLIYKSVDANGNNIAQTSTNINTALTAITGKTL